MRRLTQWALVWALVCLAWWALAEGEVPNWPFVLPASALVSALVMALVAGQMIRLRWRVLPELVCFFVWQSLLGGLDVARRALAGSVQFEGEFIRYPLSLSVGLARQIWVGGVGLFPGTLVVGVESDAVVIHVLDKNMSVLAGLLTFERYLVRLLADVREEV